MSNPDSAPTAQAPSDSPDAKTPAAPPFPDVLVVDDERGYREGIRRILTNKGYCATTAAGGAEALELASAREFGIALIDLKMPDVDGFEVIERLRAMRPDTLCVVVSAFATIESAVQTTKMGAFDFVVKPFAPDDLMRVVERASEKWNLAREAALLRAERERHLLELAAEKSRLRTILQSMGDGLLVANIDGEVVLDNPVARRLLGQVEGLNKSKRLSDLLPDPRLAAEVERMLRSTEGGFPVSLELPMAALEAGSEPRFLRATVAPIRERTGSGETDTLGVVVLLADITDAKAFDRMKTLFVSMVAHELKAPIGAVEGYLNLIHGGFVDSQPERLHEMTGRCLERTGALLALVQDLLEISRRDAGRHERRLEPVDMAEMATRLAEFHHNEAEQRGIRLVVHSDPDARRVLMDRGDLDRILTNLISNAIKYNRQGGSVDIHVVAGSSTTQLEVTDTGVGMSPDEVRRLGEEFYRAKNARTRMITGTGLGIALVKKIVDSYNGALEVRSVPEEGSTFRVVLPCQEARETTGAGQGE